MDFTYASLEIGAFSLSTFLFFSALKKYKKTQKVLKFMENAMIFTPKLLKTTMSSLGSLNYRASIKNLTEGSEFAAGEAFVQGYAYSNRPMKSILNRIDDLILSHISKNSIFTNTKINNETSEKIKTTFINEFFLGNKQSGGKQGITVMNTVDVNFKNALTQIDSVTYKRGLTAFEHFLSSIFLILRIFLSMSNIGRKMSEFMIGSQKVESGIRVGQQMIIYGTVFYDKMSKELRIDHPKYYLSNKTQLINKLKAINERCSRSMAVFSFLMSFIGLFLLKRIKKIFSNYYMRLRRNRQARKVNKLFRVSELMTNDFKCMECGVRPKNIINLPCMHMELCSQCYKKQHPKKRCRICHKVVEDSVNIYIS